jgi:hypothetical protein
LYCGAVGSTSPNRRWLLLVRTKGRVESHRPRIRQPSGSDAEADTQAWERAPKGASSLPSPVFDTVGVDKVEDF